MNNSIKIKPHHFIDIITSFSKDKILLTPHPYGHRVHSISKRIINDMNLISEIELGSDNICQPCIHNIKGTCDDTIGTSYRPKAPHLKRDWNLIIDKRWCERLKIKQGDKITILKFCNLLKENLNNITEIYKEVPKEKTIERENNLKKGLKKYLDLNVEYIDETT